MKNIDVDTKALIFILANVFIITPLTFYIGYKLDFVKPHSSYDSLFAKYFYTKMASGCSLVLIQWVLAVIYACNLKDKENEIVVRK